MIRFRIGSLCLIAALAANRIAADEKAAQQKKVADLIEALKEADPDKRGYTAEKLALIGRDAVPSLLKALEDKNTGVRVGAAWALGMLRPPSRDAIPALLSATKDKDDEVRMTAFGALVRFDPSPEGLLPVLRDAATKEPNLGRQVEAIQFLQEIGAEDSDTIRALESLLKHPSKEVRWAAVRALGAIGLEAKVASPALIACCNDASIDVVADAAPILARIDRRQRDFAVSALIEKLKSMDSVDRWASAQALGEIGTAARPAVPFLIGLLKDDDRLVRSKAALALGRIGPAAKESVPALVHVLQSDDDPYKEASSWAAWVLYKIDPQDEKSRKAVIRFLSDFVANGNQADWMRRNAAYGLAQ